jgi:hypothetical protein
MGGLQVIYQMFNQLVKFRKSFCNFTGCFFTCKTLLILLYQCHTLMLNHSPRFLKLILRLFNILIPQLSFKKIQILIMQIQFAKYLYF